MGILDDVTSAGDDLAGGLGDAVEYSSNVRLGTATFNALTPGGVTENPYGADSLQGDDFGRPDSQDSGGNAIRFAVFALVVGSALWLLRPLLEIGAEVVDDG